eukprot:5608654-Alexandrium_andersonii.AAC.1
MCIRDSVSPSRSAGKPAALTQRSRTPPRSVGTCPGACARSSGRGLQGSWQRRARAVARSRNALA